MITLAVNFAETPTANRKLVGRITIDGGVVSTDVQALKPFMANALTGPEGPYGTPEQMVSDYVQRVTGWQYMAVPLSTMKGGPGSGNFGHAGRPGEVGGSGPGGGEQTTRERSPKSGGWEFTEAKELATEFRLREGFTYNAITRSEPVTGYVVSMPRELGMERIFSVDDYNARDDEINFAYLREFREAVASGKISSDIAHIGAWKDETRVVMDVNEVYENRQEAENVGRERKQDGIYDVAKHEVIDLRVQTKKGFHTREDHWQGNGRGTARAGQEDVRGSPPLDHPSYQALKAEWDESEHPRDDHGKFTDAGGGASVNYATDDHAKQFLSDMFNEHYPDFNLSLDPKTRDALGMIRASIWFSQKDGHPLAYVLKNGKIAAAADYEARPTSGKGDHTNLAIGGMGSIDPRAGASIFRAIVSEAAEKGFGLEWQSSTAAMKFWERSGLPHNKNGHYDVSPEQVRALANRHAKAFGFDWWDGTYYGVYTTPSQIELKAFDESLHPRDDRGRFTDDGDSASELLSPKEQKVVEDYTVLTNDMPESKLRLLDSIIAKQPPLDRERTFYRGVSDEDFRTAGQKWRAGQFISVSKDRDVAKNYGDRVVKVVVQKGVRVFDYAAHNYWGMDEVIIGRTSKFVADDNNRWRVTKALDWERRRDYETVRVAEHHGWYEYHIATAGHSRLFIGPYHYSKGEYLHIFPDGSWEHDVRYGFAQPRGNGASSLDAYLTRLEIHKSICIKAGVWGVSLKDFDESLHPRDDRGRFTDSGGSDTHDSADFKKWFGRSKVVDKNGEPLMVYRGDRPGKTTFTGRENPSNYIQGNVFFSDSPLVGKFYTPGYRTDYYTPPDELDESKGMYRAFLSLQKPLVVDARGESWMSIPISRSLAWTHDGTIQIDDLAVLAREKGYDGLIVKNVFDQAGESNQYVAFHPDQIKIINSKAETKSSLKFNPYHDELGRFAEAGGSPLSERIQREKQVQFADPKTKERILNENFPWNSVALYHGTTEQAWEKISKEGLTVERIPLSDRNYDKYWYRWPEGRGSSIFLTPDKEIASFYADRVRELRGGKPLVLEIHIPPEATGRLRRDEMDWSSVRFEGRIEPSWIKRLAVKAADGKVIYLVIVVDGEDALKGGPGSGSWDGPGQPRFAWSGTETEGRDQTTEYGVPWTPSLRPEKGESAYALGERLDVTMKPSDQVWVYHFTDKQSATSFIERGIKLSDKPSNLNRAAYEAGRFNEIFYQPGVGLAPGLTVGLSPQDINGYGNTLVAVRVRWDDISPSPEALDLGNRSTGHALSVNDAYVRTDIPASNIKIFPVGPDNSTRIWEIPYFKKALKGGQGSGNFGHAGIPGHQGGSAPGDGGAVPDKPTEETEKFSGDAAADLDFANTAEEVRGILDHYKADEVSFADQGSDEKLWTIGSKDNMTVVEWDGKDSYTSVSKAEDFISSTDPERFYPNFEDDWNNQFWEYPAELYHGTPTENIDSILKDGLNTTVGTGMSNRSTMGVFSSDDYESQLFEYGSPPYGAIIKIDTGAMAADAAAGKFKLPYATREPDVQEADMRNALAHKLGLSNFEYTPDSSTGEFPSTVILQGRIPAKYVSLEYKWEGKAWIAVKGGAGSGNFGHAGRPGEVGGSAPGDGSAPAAATADQTKTPAFKRWFGDSKAVDESGKPLVLYHGTKTDFSQFDVSHSMSLGIHFGTKEVASGIVASNSYDAGGQVMPVYLSMQNPLELEHDLVFTDPEQTAKDLHQLGAITSKDLESLQPAITAVDEAAGVAAFDIYSGENNEDAFVQARMGAMRQLESLLMKHGYDGLIYPNEFEGRGTTSYAVFSPTQIKSAIGNRGSFDPSNPDITKSVKGGPGSGHWGHSSVPGQRGGSAPGDGASTGSPAFKQWFGDSKVVDDNGDPLLVHHGTLSAFDQFDMTRAGENMGPFGGTGMAFVDDRSVAETYANPVYRQQALDNQTTAMMRLDVRRPDYENAIDLANATEVKTEHDEDGWYFTQTTYDQYGADSNYYSTDRYDTEQEARDAGEEDKANDVAKAEQRLADYEVKEQAEREALGRDAHVVDAYLRIQNPKVIDYEGGTVDIASMAAITRDAKASGHDGVIFQNASDTLSGERRTSNIYIPFSADQVKIINSKKSLMQALKDFESLKFNPYHDELGKFTDAGGSAGHLDQSALYQRHPHDVGRTWVPGTSSNGSAKYRLTDSVSTAVRDSEAARVFAEVRQMESSSKIEDEEHYNAMLFISRALAQDQKLSGAERDNWRFVYAVDDQQRIVGSGTMKIEGDKGEIRSVGSTARGAGGRIITELIDGGVRRGLSAIELTPSIFAKPFYARFGFKPTAEPLVWSLDLKGKSLAKALIEFELKYK